ncbi:MAG: hypothetical protein MHM6MM_001639 [Cercozoa sp. M6MM]
MDQQVDDSFVALQLPNSLIATQWLRESELLDDARLGRTVFGAQYQCDPTTDLLRLDREVPMDLVQMFLNDANKSKMFDPDDVDDVCLFVPASVVKQRGAAALYQDLCYLCGAPRLLTACDSIWLTLDAFTPMYAVIQLSAYSYCNSNKLPSVSVNYEQHFQTYNNQGVKIDGNQGVIEAELRRTLQQCYSLWPSRIEHLHKCVVHIDFPAHPDSSQR